MALTLYNTLSRKKEIFKPIKNKKVGLYSCGPTVYWYQHIGNLRSYIFSDVLKRVLAYNDFKVKHVINITDVGHLTSDADTGEDKIESAAKREGKTAKEIAGRYLKLFKNDFKKLNILEPDKWPKATEHIKEQIALIKKLQKKGYTYKTSDGIYFNTSRLKNYGVLAGDNIKGIEAGKRIDLKEKKNPTDFALWKFSEKLGERQQEWRSPWGVGFPGWHLECSAMSMKYLGNHFDIHTGGEDHVNIHHTNEIAQSEAATGKKFVNYWIHGAYLTTKGKKVSKSKGGLFTLSELEEKGFAPLSFRYLALTTHYRKQLDFSLEALENAKNSYERLKNIISEIKNDDDINKKCLKDFEKEINDDLNMPKALAMAWNMLRDEQARGKHQTLKKMDEIFGLNLLKKEKTETPKEVQKLTDEREKARKEKKWEKADKLRSQIEKLGWNIEDKSSGPYIKPNQ